ncbi:hypothetical protein AMATHDRAFT_11180 [Amanita thiersii Skay4041]|uniref:Uncharacterized protein n=1 Tax=Amanita thiersii Skay4041 TaxID=703135 RepID=A0A2A9N5T0_9AGAR|nr:hypothetical protein AMATHDRAFT_11180 [Amanita thiersii Skay4041]
MTRNIDKNRTDDLPDGKKAFEALNEAVLDLFPGATLANRKPRSKLRFTRIPTQHSDGLPMDNGLLYHYIRKHPNFENVRFSLTPRFERSHPLKPGQVAKTEFTKTVVCEIFDTETGAVAKKCLGYAKDGTTRRNSASQTHTSAKDVEERILPPCIRRPVTHAAKATCATFAANNKAELSVFIKAQNARNKERQEIRKAQRLSNASAAPNAAGRRLSPKSS